ncbi:MAG: DUF6033 family protein [Roseburia sp.]|nr:DUF6033 family protein [Ruminococcus sp.]MCM1155936.1 DUF6033 family protein [Roseburia sp.]MCM1242851.1 DUF6033 family protein [Roseburia sp.]
MSKIAGYGVHQNSYYNNTVKDKQAKDAKKADKTAKKDTVQLSARAKKMLEELKKTYRNMDFMVADYESEEEAASYLSRGTKEFSVLIDPETLEEMAADEDAKAKYTGILEDAVGQLKDMETQLGDKKEDVKHMGISIDKEGNVSYFAELEKASERQKEFIERTRENQKESRAAQAKKAEEQVTSGRTKSTRVEADSVEELLEKIKAVDWDQIKEKDLQTSGGRFDFQV